jgi:hypothetical protein
VRPVSAAAASSADTAATVDFHVPAWMAAADGYRELCWSTSKATARAAEEPQPARASTWRLLVEAGRRRQQQLWQEHADTAAAKWRGQERRVVVAGRQTDLPHAALTRWLGRGRGRGRGRARGRARARARARGRGRGGGTRSTIKMRWRRAGKAQVRRLIEEEKAGGGVQAGRGGGRPRPQQRCGQRRGRACEGAASEEARSVLGHAGRGGGERGAVRNHVGRESRISCLLIILISLISHSFSSCRARHFRSAFYC